MQDAVHGMLVVEVLQIPVNAARIGKDALQDPSITHSEGSDSMLAHATKQPIATVEHAATLFDPQTSAPDVGHERIGMEPLAVAHLLHLVHILNPCVAANHKTTARDENGISMTISRATAEGNLYRRALE